MVNKILNLAAVVSACLALAAALHGQHTEKTNDDKNAPDPALDISPEEAAANQNYQQPYRPQFHYTPIQGFVGDATGLIYSDGTYHLFYMSDKWERRKNRHKCWGHATSRDLLHWTEEASILDPVLDHKPGSGSGIVDADNVLGLAQGNGKTLAVFYTDYQTGSCIIYSVDGGKMWIRHPRNPVLPRIGKQDRDPTVFWYGPAREWRMVRHSEPFDGIAGKTGFAFFASTNLLDWKYLSEVDGYNECPDIFELPVDGNSNDRKWVLMDAGYNYRVGQFDGTRFVSESEKLKADAAASRYLYAPQTWKRSRTGDLPLQQMGFMSYPKKPAEMPTRLTWQNQMAFPVELSLKRFPAGIRLCREPIPAIQKLYEDSKSWDAFTLKPGDNPLANLQGEQLDIRAEFDLAGASAINLNIRGQTLHYSVPEAVVSLAGTKAAVSLAENHLRLRVLVDRSSIEVFANGGQVSISRVFFFDPAEKHFSLTCEGGDLKVTSLTISHVGSIWAKNDAPAAAQ
ncbi:MAG TPA: glycoside hydrolase family 32 protein [Chthoniobacter sp.]|jgi:sucrose-6-phosphate hydrolase SacC (GH32 family)